MAIRTFKYAPDRFGEMRKVMLAKSLPIILLALAAGLAIGLRGANGGHSATNVFLIVGPFVSGHRHHGQACLAVAVMTLANS